MKYGYLILLAVLIFILCYVVANRESIILEHLDATSGPMTGATGPTPSGVPDVASTPSELTPDQKAVCSTLKATRDSADIIKRATFKAASDQGKIPEYCKSMLSDLSDVSALASKLTDLQQDVDNMKAQAKEQSAQAAAAQASLQAIR
jgi:outer membrane murein-binding lipoprotein Lpp